MKTLSIWAKNNPRVSRYLIAISHLLIITNAICMGILFYFCEWNLPQWTVLLTTNLFFIIYLIYPQKTKGTSKFLSSYTKRKLCDFGLVILYSLSISLGINHTLDSSDHHRVWNQNPEATFIVNKSNLKHNLNKKRSFFSRVKDKYIKFKNKIKKDFQELKMIIKAQKDSTGIWAIKILLTLLTIGLALVLGALVALLACNLSCSGQEGLAFVVIVLGFGGIVWLGVIAIKNIYKKIGQKKMQESSAS